MIPFKAFVAPIDHSSGIHIDVLRLDLIHPLWGGNKIYKLHYNIEAAHKAGYKSILTFGGPHSNHIFSTAHYAAAQGFKSIGVIRSRSNDETPTLQSARNAGMEIIFVSPAEYDSKEHPEFFNRLPTEARNAFVIEEGGANGAGMLGCEEILTGHEGYDYAVCACGTGTTFAGLVRSHKANTVVGINVLKGSNGLAAEIARKLDPEVVKGNEALRGREIDSNCITDAYAFDGYACFSPRLIEFKHQFESRYALPLDHIYTAKMFYGLFDLIDRGLISSSSRVLAMHSGGLQGNAAFERRYSRKLIR